MAIRNRVAEEATHLRDGLHGERVEIDRREHRLTEREERLDLEHQQVQAQRGELDDRAGELDEARIELEEKARRQQIELERIAGLSADAARAELIAGVEAEAKLAASGLVRDIERQAQADADMRAGRSSPAPSSAWPRNRPRSPWCRSCICRTTR